MPSASPRVPSGRTRPLRPGVTAALLALACLASLPFLVHGWYDPTNDGSMYVATARSLVRGEGYAFLGEPFRIRPPGFAVLIAPLVAAGAGFFALNLFVSLFGVATVVVLYLVARPRVGSLLALLVALAVWLSPGFQRLCNQVMSDVPGVALVGVCLLYERRLRRRGPAAPRARLHQLGLGVAIALSTYVRTSALLLLPAILAARCLRRFGRHAGESTWRDFTAGAGLLVLGVVGTLAPWSLRDRAVAPEGPADQTRLYSYGTGMWHADMGDPASERLAPSDVLGRFPQRVEQLTASLGNRLDSNRSHPGATLFTLLIVGSTLAVLVRRREPTELFVLANLAVVSVYFGYAGRLMLPCLVFGLPAAAEVVRGLVRIFAPARFVDPLAALPLVALIVADFDPRRRWDEIERLHQGYEQVAAEVERQVAPDDVLAAYRGWHLMVYLDRPVYGFEQVQRRLGRPEACEALIEKYGIDKVVLVPIGLPSSLVPEYTRLETYLENRHGRAPGPVKVVDVRR